MKCIICEKPSPTHICKKCQELFLAPSFYKRKVFGVDVFSFYKYEDIKDFLHTKHTDLGYYIYNILAKNSFYRFAKEFKYGKKLLSLGIDDKVKTSSHSHTAILNRHLKSTYIKPLFGKIKAKNNVSYSGKSKEYRLKNKRDFILKDFNGDLVILVDDIVTTGLTLTEAISTLKINKKDVVFCLTLADARE